MIILIGRDHKERIVLGKTVRRQPGEEFAEGCIVFFELCDISCLAGAKRAIRIGGETMIVMGIFNVPIDDQHARLEHGREIAQRLRRRGATAGHVAQRRTNERFQGRGLDD